MKRGIIIFLICIAVDLLFSQAPVVSNVSFNQRTDGSLMVDIYYDLSDDDGEIKNIVIEASDDNGSTWDLICSCLTGDVGLVVSCGTNKHVVWDFCTDNPNVSGSNYKIRVIASEVGTMTGNDGRVYQTVKIGNQWWMAENLKETMFRGGSVIPNVIDNATWSGLSTGARCAYNNNETTAETYGYLYNWYALIGTDDDEIAPTGWHVPTDSEWKQLEMHLGMTPGQADANSWRGTDEGGKMKVEGTTHWISPNYGATNESGLSVLPGGIRSDVGHFEMGASGYYWTCSGYSSSHAYARLLRYDYQKVDRSWRNKRRGLSVRLVKD